MVPHGGADSLADLDWGDQIGGGPNPRGHWNWFGNDKREKEGVAIYARDNIIVKRVQRSEVYETISLEIELPSGHQLLFCGIYHPPKPKYPETEFIDYLTDTVE